MESVLKRHMNVLCADIGERHLGSSGEAEAAGYIQAEFEAAGYAVKRQEFEAPGWRYGEFSLHSERGKQDFSCFPCFYSNGGEAVGEPVFLDMDNHGEDIRPESFAGKIVFAHGSFETVRNTNTLAMDLDRAGAEALVITSPYQDTFSTKIVRQPGLKKLITLTVSKNTALQMARALKNDRLHLKVDAENFRYRTSNVCAVPEETGSKEKKVIIGAHYDTAPGIQGAGDDASGTAILLALAKAMKKEFKEAGASVELVAFTGEEYGGTSGSGLGAERYVLKNLPEPETTPWMAEIDDVGTFLGRFCPVVYPDRDIYRALNAVMGEWNLNAEYRRLAGCDVGPFNNLGIPTVFFSESKPASGNGHFPLHSPMDNLELIDPDKLLRDAGIIRRCIEVMLGGV